MVEVFSWIPSRHLVDASIQYGEIYESNFEMIIIAFGFSGYSLSLKISFSENSSLLHNGIWYSWYYFQSETKRSLVKADQLDSSFPFIPSSFLFKHMCIFCIPKKTPPHLIPSSTTIAQLVSLLAMCRPPSPHFSACETCLPYQWP